MRAHRYVMYYHASQFQDYYKFTIIYCASEGSVESRRYILGKNRKDLRIILRMTLSDPIRYYIQLSNF